MPTDRKGGRAVAELGVRNYVLPGYVLPHHDPAGLVASVLVLARTNTPTPEQAAAALADLFPHGGRHTVADLLAAGLLEPTPDRHRLREPPLPLAEQDARLAAYESKTALMPELVLKLNTTPLPAAHESKAGLVPERVLKLNTTAPAPLAGQDTRLATDKTVDITDLAANSVDFTELAANPQGTGYHRPILNKRAEQDTRLATASPLDLRELAAHATGPEFSPSEVKNPVGGKLPPPAPRFSYYRDGIATTTPYAAVTPLQLWTVLVSPRQRAQTEALRAAAVGSPERADLKKRLDYVTPAGTLTRRSNAGLVTASGLLVLDFDHLPDVAAARAALLADDLLAPELVLLFVSPSGDGLKALVTADPTAAHLDNFRAYADYLGRTYAALGLVPDEAGKDVARACFVPYAPDAWLAPAYAA